MKQYFNILYTLFIPGVFPIFANQQKALRRPVLHQSRRPRQDGLQRDRDSAPRQLPSGGQPHQHMLAEDSH